VGYIRHSVVTFCVVAANLGLKSPTLNLFLRTLVFHLLFVGLIRFFVVQKFNCLDVDFYFIFGDIQSFIRGIGQSIK
jgi:hypothetical protein